MKLVTLCSGGLDSTTLAYLLADLGEKQKLLFIHYGQKHIREQFSAVQCSLDLGVPLRNVTITGRGIFKSALTDPNLKIPSGEYAPENLASTVVPNRNSIMANL
jgi:7-cyano-7-deazaguanine synthase